MQRGLDLAMWSRAEGVTARAKLGTKTVRMPQNHSPNIVGELQGWNNIDDTGVSPWYQLFRETWPNRNPYSNVSKSWLPCATRCRSVSES